MAAVSVATRVAEEMRVPLGDLVGYGVRFDDATSQVGCGIVSPPTSMQGNTGRGN
jgi:hypothetical protein